MGYLALSLPSFVNSAFLASIITICLYQQSINGGIHLYYISYNEFLMYLYFLYDTNLNIHTYQINLDGFEKFKKA